jgi:hypothetical protein
MVAQPGGAWVGRYDGVPVSMTFPVNASWRALAGATNGIKTDGVCLRTRAMYSSSLT